MKRVCNDLRRGANRRSDGRPRISPIVIQLEEDDDSRSNHRSSSKHRRRDDARLLNLLVRAIVESNLPSKNEGASIPQIQHGNNILKRNSSAIASIKSSSSMKRIGSFTRRKQAIHRIPSDDRWELVPSNHGGNLCGNPLSPLPNGRPLMAPPRLPTHFIPRQQG